MTVGADVALAAHDAGLCVVKVKLDGSKRPDVGSWKKYQAARPSRDTVAGWFPHPAIGVLCGAVSGGLEMLEFEGRAVAEGKLAAFVERCADHGLADLLDRIEAGYCERTPSGGIHYLYRCDEIEGNLKLARRPSTPEELAENPDEPLQVLIETRGEGGFVVVAPTTGAAHLSGQGWVLQRGGFDTIATITAEERAALFAMARSFDEIPEPVTFTAPRSAPAEEQTPLGWYDENTTCDEVLERAGFTHDHTDGSGRHYTRPGKDRRAGTSATVWADNGTATLFSTSISAPGEYIGNRNLRPSQLAAALLYGGDHSALARDVSAQMPDRVTSPFVAPGAVAVALPDPADLPPPRELPGIVGSTVPFPIDALPDWIAEPVTSVADSIQVPVDLPATIALGCLSSLTQGKVHVITPGSQWREWTNLYLAVSLKSGEGKSPAYKALTGVVYELEKEHRAASRNARNEAEARRAVLEARRKKVETGAATSGDPASMDEAIRLRLECESLVMPPDGQMIADDATPEALAVLMADAGGRMTIMSPEGQVFNAMAGAYVAQGDKVNMDVFLKGFSGESLRQNRVGRGSIDIDQAILTISVCTQPDMLEALADTPALAARGATARFMYSVPTSMVGHRDRSKKYQSWNVEGWEAGAGAIGRRFLANENPISLSLTADARAVFDPWDQDVEDRCRDGYDLENMAAWAQKLRSCVLRVAGLLAVADGCDEITQDAAERATWIGDYWIEHAKIVHRMWGVEDRDLTLAKRIAGWLSKKYPDGGEVKLSAINHGVYHSAAAKGRKRDLDLSTGAKGAAALVPAAEILVAHGWLTPTDPLWITQAEEGKRSPTFLVPHLSQRTDPGTKWAEIPNPSRDSRIRVYKEKEDTSSSSSNISECTGSRTRERAVPGVTGSYPQADPERPPPPAPTLERSELFGGPCDDDDDEGEAT